MKMKKIGLGILTAVALAGCAGNAGGGNTIKLGGNFELSGLAASYGTSMNNGVTLALEEKGTLLEKPIEYISYDNKSDKTEVASVAKKLLSENVVGMFGPATTSDSQAASPIYDQAKIPTIYPATTGDTVLEATPGSVYEFIFRVCFADSYQGIVGANFISQKFPNAKVAIIQDSASEYSQGLVKTFTEEYTAKGGTIVTTESYQANDTDFQAILTSVKSQNVDVIYVPGYYTEVGLLIKQARELGITTPIVGGDGWASEKLFELAGAANLTDVYYTSHYSDLSQDSDVQSFIKAYQEKYNVKPDTFAALAYDAGNLLVKAIEQAGTTDAAAVQKALLEIKDFNGVTGTFSMGADHTPVKSAVVIEIQNGQEVSAEEVSAE